MSRGGARVGAGRPKKAKAILAKQQLSGHEQLIRPSFVSAKDFAIWALNAPDLEVDMDQKMRAMQALLSIEAKQPAEKSPTANEKTEAGGVYAPRRVRGFGVVAGGRE